MSAFPSRVPRTEERWIAGVLAPVLVGLLAAAAAVILALIDSEPTTKGVRDAAVTFGGTTTLGLLLIGALRSNHGEGAE
ncbi:hypothetical protein ACGFYA_29160 [Streptomyces sp. NPDC048305]|uniref:hypothetical protein n=1 Tax=Streptomyces sp. NPDC048305 TaxID=3365532 RepID=UPI0037191A83